MRASRRWVPGLLICGLLPACDARPAEDAPPPATAATATPLPARPAQVERTLRVEGMEERMRFRLVRSPEGFPLPFSTYVPEDMDAEFGAIDTGHVVNFPARFGGQRADRARLTIHAYPPGTPADQAQNELAAYLSGLYPDDTPLDRGEQYEQAMPVEPASRYPWATEESRYRVPGDPPGSILTGRAGVSSHGGRIFFFIIEYPAEFADGMSPRIEAILNDWRWEDTGESLGGG